MANAHDESEISTWGFRLYSSTFYTFGFTPSGRVLVLACKNQRYSSIEAVRAENERVGACLAQLSVRRLVFDARQAPLVEHVSFDSALQAMRTNLGRYFDRIAVLVSSGTVGMRCSRWFHGTSAEVMITLDPAEAERFVAERESDSLKT